MFMSVYMLMIIFPSWHLTAWDTFPTPITINSLTTASPFSHQCIYVIDALHSGDAFLSFHLYEAKRGSESGEYWVLVLMHHAVPCLEMMTRHESERHQQLQQLPTTCMHHPSSSCPSLNCSAGRTSIHITAIADLISSVALTLTGWRSQGAIRTCGWRSFVPP